VKKGKWVRIKRKILATKVLVVCRSKKINCAASSFLEIPPSSSESISHLPLLAPQCEMTQRKEGDQWTLGEFPAN
jgi:hypothetical protein